MEDFSALLAATGPASTSAPTPTPIPSLAYAAAAPGPAAASASVMSDYQRGDPLLAAVREGDLDLLRSLVVAAEASTDAKEAVNAERLMPPNSRGLVFARTLLQEAVVSAKMDCIRFLLFEKHADLQPGILKLVIASALSDDVVKQVMLVLIEKFGKQLLESIPKPGAGNPHPFMYAVARGNLDLVKLFTETLEFNYRDATSERVSQHQAMMTMHGCFNDDGAGSAEMDYVTFAASATGTTAIHVAASFGRLQVLTYLLSLVDDESLSTATAPTDKGMGLLNLAVDGLMLRLFEEYKAYSSSTRDRSTAESFRGRLACVSEAPAIPDEQFDDAAAMELAHGRYLPVIEYCVNVLGQDPNFRGELVVRHQEDDKEDEQDAEEEYGDEEEGEEDGGWDANDEGDGEEEEEMEGDEEAEEEAEGADADDFVLVSENNGDQSMEESHVDEEEEEGNEVEDDDEEQQAESVAPKTASTDFTRMELPSTPLESLVSFVATYEGDNLESFNTRAHIGPIVELLLAKGGRLEMPLKYVSAACLGFLCISSTVSSAPFWLFEMLLPRLVLENLTECETRQVVCELFRGCLPPPPADREYTLPPGFAPFVDAFRTSGYAIRKLDFLVNFYGARYPAELIRLGWAVALNEATKKLNPNTARHCISKLGGTMSSWALRPHTDFWWPFQEAPLRVQDCLGSAVHPLAALFNHDRHRYVCLELVIDVLSVYIDAIQPQPEEVELVLQIETGDTLLHQILTCGTSNDYSGLVPWRTDVLVDALKKVLKFAVRNKRSNVLNVQNARGRTPIHVAASCHDALVMQTLLSYPELETRHDIEDATGLTPWEVPMLPEMKQAMKDKWPDYRRPVVDASGLVVPCDFMLPEEAVEKAKACLSDFLACLTKVDTLEDVERAEDALAAIRRMREIEKLFTPVFGDRPLHVYVTEYQKVKHYDWGEGESVPYSARLRMVLNGVLLTFNVYDAHHNSYDDWSLSMFVSNALPPTKERAGYLCNVSLPTADQASGKSFNLFERTSPVSLGHVRGESSAGGKATSITIKNVYVLMKAVGCAHLIGDSEEESRFFHALINCCFSEVIADEAFGAWRALQEE
jgi:ankyrin repeat protein